MVDFPTVYRWAANAIPVVATSVGAGVAYLVYRLNADRLYLDTFDKRRDAITNVLQAASDREEEAAALACNPAGWSDLPAQRKFWIAKDVAWSLFDPPVQRALDKLDEALRDSIIARSEFADARAFGEALSEAERRHADCVTAVYKAREDLVKKARPFINLGSKGLAPWEALRRRLGR